MAKPRCKKHKRSLPYCDDCKLAVKQAEEREASEALKSEVGFPGADEPDPAPVPETGEPTPAEKRIEELESQTPESVEAEEEQALVGLTGEPVETNTANEEVEPETSVADPIPDPWANGKTPEEGQDVGDWQPPEADVKADPEPVVEIDEGGNIVPVERQSDTSKSWNPEAIAEYTDELAEKLRQAGRKEVIAAVREYFADSIDTVAFQLLEYLEKKYS